MPTRRVQRLCAGYVSIDRIREESSWEEWEGRYVSERSFLRANEVAVRQTPVLLQRGRPVVLDRNLYWSSVIEGLVGRLSFSGQVFILRAPLELCVERDRQRTPARGR
ncbi:MAG TPA: hypothetical protein VKT21_02095, partial [Thermoplasmata archaeon]|nr:hypothetical protein [Thermoplasmata archaeon]